MTEGNKFGEMIEKANQEIRDTGQMALDKDLTGFQFSCGICGNVGYVGGVDGAILHDNERPECNVCGFRGIHLFKFKPKKDICPVCMNPECPKCSICRAYYCDRCEHNSSNTFIVEADGFQDLDKDGSD